ncbi:MAG: family 10 glycosylhydrolase [Muribaculaceae bacterium]|nr:family 10 glycosylhydrolase [Muribaculaceae bacterium]
MKIKKYLWGFAVASLALTACGDDDSFDPSAQAPEPPVPDVVPEPPTIKPKAMWIDAHANFELLSKAANIDAQLDKIKQYGYNMIYLDVKPGNGYALYDSDILPPCNTFGTQTVTRDYDDYLGYFLQKCEELEIDVIASIGATGFGHGAGVNQGYVFDNWSQWGDKCQIRSVEGDPDKTVSVADDPQQAVVMLTPSSLEVQDLIVSICSEVVTKYPKIKGISLDYLRYCNNDGGWYGLGPIDLQGYAEYWGESVPERTEIVTATGGVGPKFAKWIEFRSMKVTETIQRIRNTVKAINPDCEIHLRDSAG